MKTVAYNSDLVIEKDQAYAFIWEKTSDVLQIVLNGSLDAFKSRDVVLIELVLKLLELIRVIYEFLQLLKFVLSISSKHEFSLYSCSYTHRA